MPIDSDNYKRAGMFLSSANRILLTTHVRPDGDAMGSLAAMKHVLEAARGGVEVTTLFLSKAGGIYQFLVSEGTKILGEDITSEQIADGALNEFDAIVVCDTGAERQLEGVFGYLKSHQEKVVVIDHHLSNDGIGGYRLVNTQACAAGEIVFEFFREAGWAINEQAARALFVAIATDTGWFRFENTSARSLQIAAELIEAGAKVDVLYQQLFQQDRPERLRLQSAAMGTLELYCDGRLAVMEITRAMLEETGAQRWEIENIVNEPMRLGSVVASLLLVEQEDGGTRCSLRSKAVVDVNAVAKQLGGGGHARAAGVTLKESLEQAKEKIVSGITSALDCQEDAARHHHRGRSSEKLLNKEDILCSLVLMEGQVVLDAGCGDGYMAKEFARRVKASGKVYALDPDEIQITILQSTCPTGVIEAFVGDITQKTKLQDASVDVVYLSTVIHGFSETQMNGFIEEVQRLLKPKGTLAILEIKKEETPFGPPLSIRLSADELKARIPLKPKQTKNIGDYFYLQLFEK